MLEVLSDALIKYGYFFRNTIQKTDVILERLLQEFYDDEMSDLELFLQSTVDVSAWDIDKVENRNNDIHGEIIYRRHAICHTALLPSHARSNGLLMDDGKNTGSKDIDMGTNLYFLSKPEDGILPLAFDPNDRQLCDALEIDHKDFFYVKEGDGWLSLTVPTNSELKAYGKKKTLQPTLEENQPPQSPQAEEEKEQQKQQQLLPPPEGLIMVCLKICPMGRCSDDRIGFGKYSESSKKLFMKVDGKPVTDVKRLEGCHFLSGENGIRWGPGQASMDGRQYDLKFRVEDPGTGHWLRISSIIVL